MRFILTGGSGWLGSNLIGLLTRSARELAGVLDRNLDAALALGVQKSGCLIKGDITDPEACRELCEKGGEDSVLIHTAGVIHPKRTEEFYRVNHRGALTLLRAAAKAGVRRAVMISSNSPFGFNPGPGRRFNESSPYNPYMNYGRSKMLMEKDALSFGAKNGIEIVILRPPWFYGPPQPPRQTLFFRMIRDGKMPLIGPGTNLRSMAWVPDLAAACLLAAETPGAAGKAYWVADERPYSMCEIVETVRRLLSNEFGIPCSRRSPRLPAWVSRAAQFADGLIQASGFYSPKIHVLSELGRTIACDISRARRELSFSPSISIEEGMRRSIRWCIQNGGLG